MNLFNRRSENVAVWEVFSELPVRNRLSLKKKKQDQVSSSTTLHYVTLTLSKLRTNRHVHNHDTAKGGNSREKLDLAFNNVKPNEWYFVLDSWSMATLLLKVIVD